MSDKDELLVAVAKIIVENEMSINEFYNKLGIDLDDLERSEPDNEVALLAGILTGWENPQNI